jgi:hypothetical protein
MLIQEKVWKAGNDFFNSLPRASGMHLAQDKNSRHTSSLFSQNNFKNSKQPRKFSKIQYVTDDDV